MQDLFVYSVFDQKAEIYNTPVFQLNDAVAERAFYYGVKTGDLGFAEDFILVRIGKFDAEKGSIEPETGYVVCKGLEIKAQLEKENGSKD
jgi:hypothetical protein